MFSKKQNTKGELGVCIHMNGAKCAGNYCDYWNSEKQICSLSLESKLKVELFEERIRLINKEKEKIKNKNALKKFKKKFNIVTDNPKSIN